MKNEPSEPSGGEPTSPTLDRYLRVARGHDASDAALRRVADKLATAGVLASTPPRSAPARWKLYSKVGIGLVVLAGAWGSWRTLHSPPASANSLSFDESRAEVSTSVPSKNDISKNDISKNDISKKTANADSPSFEMANSALPQAAISVDALPSVARPPAQANAASTSISSARAVAPAAALAPAKTPGESADQPKDDPAPPPKELELVQRAQAMLATDPERALAVTREQARLYPAGEYIQEREVFAVEALSRLGRKEEARSRANALLQRFPRTPYVSRLEIAIGGRLAVPAGAAP